MKQRGIIFLLIVIGTQVGFPQSSVSSNTPLSIYSVDFSKTLEDFYRITKTMNDSWVPKKTSFIIDGTIGSIMVRSEADNSFVAEAEILQGKWKDEITIELYRAYVLFEGPQFRPFFTRGDPRQLKNNQSVLLLVDYLGLGTDYDEVTPVVVFRCRMIRPLW